MQAMLKPYAFGSVYRVLWKIHAHHTRCWIYHAKGGDLTFYQSYLMRMLMYEKPKCLAR